MFLSAVLQIAFA